MLDGGIREGSYDGWVVGGREEKRREKGVGGAKGENYA